MGHQKRQFVGREQGDPLAGPDPESLHLSGRPPSSGVELTIAESLTTVDERGVAWPRFEYAAQFV